MNTFHVTSAAVCATLVATLTVVTAAAPASAQRDRDLTRSAIEPTTRSFDIAEYVAHRKELWAASGPQLPMLS